MKLKLYSFIYFVNKVSTRAWEKKKSANATVFFFTTGVRRWWADYWPNSFVTRGGTMHKTKAKKADHKVQYWAAFACLQVHRGRRFCFLPNQQMISGLILDWK
jgi:hypothetical protein